MIFTSCWGENFRAVFWRTAELCSPLLKPSDVFYWRRKRREVDEEEKERLLDLGSSDPQL